MIVSRRSILVIIFLLLLACLFSACEKMDEDYIEVVDIRVSPSTIYLSPDGETSTYQIPEPTIIPHNATNRKVIYYASPEDLEYFSVDANGLVSAKKLTEDKKAFIRVSSSTNKTAYTLLTVIIENVDVEEISFAQREMKVQYTEDPFYVEPLFSPYHAQYGRDVVFSSSNPDVLTVDNEGLVTLNQVGIATVRAQAGSSLTSGKIVEGYIRIISGYAPGVYDLEVTSESPQFDQVVGEPSSISFNIPKGLYLSTDPKPDIKWYVGEIRDSKQDGEWSFKFEPDPNSNPTSFVVEARITPKGESTITLKSPLISLYRAFSGFSLYIHQPEGQVYHYGEEIALVPEEEEDNISDSYKWYMKEQGAKGLGKYIGSTVFNEQDKAAFKFFPDSEGMFVVSALMIKDNVEIEKEEFKFSVVKYMEGDRIQVTPQTNIEEKIPESYDWYVHEYYPNTGDYNKEGTQLYTTIGNAPFTYEALEAGWYILRCSPTQDGQPIFETIDNEQVAMQEFSQPFQVWPLEGETAIESVLIDATQVEQEYKTVIKWSAIGGVNDFIVEICKDEEIFIIKTAEEDKNDGVIYRDYSIVLPRSMVFLDEDFSVRIKRRGSAFSQTYNYKANDIPEKYYYYLQEINYGINGYIQDMNEMGELLEYIAAFRPKSLLADESEGQVYKIKINTPMQYRRIDNNKYPVLTQSPYDEDDNRDNIYHIIMGVIYARQINTIFDLEIEYDAIYDGFDISISLLSNEGYFYQKGDGIQNFGSEDNYTKTPRQQEDFAIDSKETIEVVTSEQLYYAVTNGKQPLPKGDSIAKLIYDEARFILLRIIDNNMSDYQKVLAIYDFLALEVENDKVLEEYSKQALTENLYLYDGFYLEGVFLHRKAISVGKSKAFNFLCWIEGITSKILYGERRERIYSWNKVCLDEYWYNIDTYTARVQREDGATKHYSKFLIEDQRMKDYGYKSLGDTPLAIASYELSTAIKGYFRIEEEGDIEEIILLHTNKVNEEGDFSFNIEFTREMYEEYECRDILIQQLGDILADSEVTAQVWQITDEHYVILLEDGSLLDR